MQNEKIALYENFALGLNTLMAPNRLNDAALPTATNVWFDTGAVSKRLGQTRVSSTNTVFGIAWYGKYMHASAYAGAPSLLISALNWNGESVLLKTTSVGTVAVTTVTGVTGTATTTILGTTVGGVGTNWLTTVRTGALINIGATVAKVLTVNSDILLTLTGAFGADNTGVAYTITTITGSRCSFVDMNSKTWVSAIGAPSVSWNGTTLAFVDAFPKANYSIEYKNYIFAANTAANPTRIAWSSLKDPTTWPAANFVDVNPDDGFPIVGLVYDGQSIVILKTTTAWKLTGDIFDPANPTYTLTQIDVPSDFLINGPGSFQNFSPGNYIMLGQKGFYSYNGGASFVKMLEYDRVRSLFDNLAGFNVAFAASPDQEPRGAIIDGNYWLQVAYSNSATAVKDTTLVIDKTGAIWQWTYANPAILYDFAYFTGTLYGVNGYSGGTAGLLQINTASTDGLSSAINGTFTTRIFEFANQQRFGVAYVYFKKQSAGNLTFEYSIDEGSFSSVTIGMTTGTGTRIKSAPIVIGSVGRAIQFRFSNNVAAQTFEVYGIKFNRMELRQ